jgi:zinc transporter ZupT
VSTTVATVFVAALVTALATGLGALPFAFRREGALRRLGQANAVASGVMLGAAAGLLVEGVQQSPGGTVAGAVAGGAFVYVASRAVAEHDVRAPAGLHGAAAHKALLIVGVMTAHSAAEGIGVGAAFGDTATFGLLIATAIALHNIPEGLAISLVLVPRGTRVRTAAGWSIFSSLPQPLLAVPAFLFVEQFRAVLPAGLGFAAGAMVWMVARELLPEAIAHGPRRAVALDAIASFAAMLALQLRLTT